MESSPRPNGMGRQQPKTRTRRLGRRSITRLLGGCWAGIGRCGGRGWSTLQPVGQRPAAEAPCQVGALPQSPAGRGGRAARFGATRRLLQGPAGNRHRHGDEHHLPGPPPCSGSHAPASVRCHRSIAGRLELLARQQVEHDGEDHRGDDREQDHQQASRPAAQRPDLDASRAHLWLLLRRRVIGCSTGVVA
jgi:hypothetical protein